MASCKLLVALFVLSNFDNYCLVGADTLEEGNNALELLGLPLILTAETDKSKVLFMVVCNKPICDPTMQVKALSVGQLDKFWMPFLLGCKQDVLKKWFKDNTESEEMGSAAGGSSKSASNPTESAKEIVTEWKNNKKPEDTITTITSLIPGKYCNFAKDSMLKALPPKSEAKQSYIEELADFYYDEEVEEARKTRSWFILNAQKKRADRAAAHGSMYADDLLYDYYENVNVETRRAQDVYDRLQRENVKVQAKRDQVLSSKKRIRRKPKPSYRYN
eukprot:205403_1